MKIIEVTGFVFLQFLLLLFSPGALCSDMKQLRLQDRVMTGKNLNLKQVKTEEKNSLIDNCLDFILIFPKGAEQLKYSICSLSLASQSYVWDFKIALQSRWKWLVFMFPSYEIAFILP